MHGTSRRWRWVALGASVAVVAALMLGVWGLARSSTVHAAPIFSERHMPVSEVMTDGCPGGEDVALSGEMQIVIHGTTDGAGGTHFDVQVNTQGVSGVGLTSGAKYEFSGGHTAISHTSAVTLGTTTTNTDDGRLIGQGPDNNWFFTFLFHLTVNADGTTTASFTNFEFACH